MVNTYFLSGRLKFGHVQGRHMWKSPIKTLDMESLMSFPNRQHLMCCHKSLLQELNMSHVTPLGEDSWRLVPGFFWSSPHAPLLCADFALYPFAIINHNHHYMLSPWTLLPNHLAWEWSWEPLMHRKAYILYIFIWALLRASSSVYHEKKKPSYHKSYYVSFYSKWFHFPLNLLLMCFILFNV